MSAYLSTGAFRARRVGEVLDIARRHGFDRIELSTGLDYEPDIVETVRRRRDGFAFLVHNYFPPSPTPFVLNLASPDRRERDASLCYARSAVDLCAELACPFYSVHAGFALPLRVEELGSPRAQLERLRAFSGATEDAYGSFVETVLELTRHARSKGVRLLVENNVVAPELAEQGGGGTLLLATPEEIRRFMRDVRCPDIGLLLDTGHAAVTATAFGLSVSDFVEQVGQYVGCLHLSDNSGRSDEHSAFGRAAWFAPYLARFRGVPVVIEAYDLTPRQMREQLELVAELMA
jgi:sugar phosphate isomerase/epimerase